jgi:hypothetical protein
MSNKKILLKETNLNLNLVLSLLVLDLQLVWEIYGSFLGELVNMVEQLF